MINNNEMRKQVRKVTALFMYGVVDSDGTASRPDLGWVSLFRCFETQTAVFGHVAVFVPGQLSLSFGVEGSQLHW